MVKIDRKGFGEKVSYCKQMKLNFVSIPSTISDGSVNNKGPDATALLHKLNWA